MSVGTAVGGEDEQSGGCGVTSWESGDPSGRAGEPRRDRTGSGSDDNVRASCGAT